MPRGEGEAAAEAPNSLVTPKNEPSEAASSASRLLTASTWIGSDAGPSNRGEFVASTIDVDAIKRSPERFEHSTVRKEPLMTIPENWATINEEPALTSSKKGRKFNAELSEDSASDSDSNSESSEESEESGSDECSSCSTCSDSDEDSEGSDDSSCSSSSAAPARKSKKFNKSRFIVESRSAVVKRISSNEITNGGELLVKGSVSQAETLNNQVKSTSSKISKKVTNSSSTSKQTFASRKFFKRKQQLNYSTVSNGPNYRQHQPSHHHHNQQLATMATANPQQQPQQQQQSSASGSCVMERLGSAVSHLHSEEVETNGDSTSNEVAQIDHFAEHFVGHMATTREHQSSSQSSSDNTFHPITADGPGLQVIQDEDLVAILKDVSGDTYSEDNNDCDKRLRNLDFVNETADNKMKRIRSTADVVAEAIQRFDTSIASTSSVISSKSSSSVSANKSDLSNKASKCQSLVNQQRQRHSSSKKKKKSGYTPILPAPDIDLYLNSNSNVSPDSGIQSEGTGSGGSLTNSSPPQLLTSSQTSTELVPTQQQSFQFSPGSAAVYQWQAPQPQNGYYPSITTDWTMATNSAGYILSNSGTALIVTSLQPPEVSPAETLPILTPASTVNANSSAPSTVSTVPSFLEGSKDISNTLKRGRGRPKGSKNKKKKSTMESGCQTVESSLESKLSSVSSSPCSALDEEDLEDDNEEALPPPPMFMGGVDDPSIARTGRPRKDPPRLEPQIDPPPALASKEVIILESEDDDHSTIMFSDGEDDLEDDPPPPKLEQPPVLSIAPPVLSQPPQLQPTLSKPKKKKKKKSKELEHPASNSPMPTLSKPKKKRKKRSKERSPPRLEPIHVQVEQQTSTEFEQVAVNVSPVCSPKELSPVPQVEAEVKIDDPKSDDKKADDKEPVEAPEEEKKPSFCFGDVKPLFSAKYRTLKVDKFWKKKKSKKIPSVAHPALAKKPTMEGMVPKVTTKAAVKEIVNIPLMPSTSTTPSTKTMLAVLKSTSLKSKPGRKKKGKSSSSSKKKEPLELISDRDSVSSKSPASAFSPRSVASSNDENEFKKKKTSTKKSLIELGWRTKHKNVVDPVFLGMLEGLMQEMGSIQIDSKMSKDLWPDRPDGSVPSIFRKRKIILSTSSKATFEKKRGRPKKDKEAEQRLPLKKRHHHHQAQNDSDVPPGRRSSATEKKSSSGRSSRKSSTDEQRKPSSNKKVNAEQYLSPSTGNSPVKNVNIVETIAACVDKYTGKSKKDFTQPLTVVTCSEESDKVKALGSPRKRHLLKMQNQCGSDLAPPTLEKVDDSPPEIVNDKQHSPDILVAPDLEAEKRPSSPPKLSRFDDEKPVTNAGDQLMSPISEDEQRPNIYRPKVSDISEDDISDLDKAISPRTPIMPRILKQGSCPAPNAGKNGLMNCSVRMKKLASPSPKQPSPPVLNPPEKTPEPVVAPTTPAVEEMPDISKEVPEEKLELAGKSLKKKKKRRANKTGFPALKKKKKTNDQISIKEGQAKVTKKSRKAKVTKKINQLPVRSSARIIAEKSDTDSRPGSRIDVKRPSSSLDDHEPVVQVPIKRSKLYEDVDEDVDCLALLPLNDMEEDYKLEAQEEQNGGLPNTNSKRSRRKGLHLFKKNYLIAGLFSNFYKETKSNTSAPVPINKVIYKTDEHVHGLLPPPYYCGRQLRAKKEDFTLPHDLWWQHVNKQLPGRDVVPTWNYKRIKSNVYFDVAKPAAKGYDMQACPCQPPQDPGIQACQEDCINRMTYNECDTDLCSLPEDKCANRRIQKQKGLNGHLERFMTEAKGWGIKTKIPILTGDFIMEYVGEVVSEKEFKLRMLTEYIEDTHHYCLHLDGGTVIDGHRMGNECRFVNHSCDPNCEMQKWNVNGHYRMALFALKEIQPGEELTYDYNFSLFNPHEGQRCKCGSRDCRGVIGGKTQRIINHKRKPSVPAEKCKKSKAGHDQAFSLMAPLKPLSHQQKTYVQDHHCFLFRNYEKVRAFREAFHNLNFNKEESNANKDQDNDQDQAPVNEATSEDMILTGITALTTARSMQTRRLAIAQDDPKVTKVVKIAQVLREICAQVHENCGNAAKLFKELPTRKKCPEYFQHIEEPLDFSSIEKLIHSGSYTHPDTFDKDMLKLFQNNLRFYGSRSTEGQATLELRKSYFKIKLEYCQDLQNILGEDQPLVQFKKSMDATEALGNPEDVINCPCGQFKEEGTMIQCEKCQIWLHLDCVEAPEDPEQPYFCSSCSGVPPTLDIKLVPQPEHYPGDTDYVSLMRDDMQVRLGDTVYVLRAIKSTPEEKDVQVLDDNENDKTSEADKSESKSFDLGGIKHKMMSPVKGPSQEASNLTKNNYPSYKSVKNPDTQDMDIFHVERLWINDKGERFAFGYHYLRPNETFHEASRKFFANEVFRIPIYEVLPLETIWRQCWVMDLPTYCKGRPKGATEEHVYICEFRVDKKARLFDKIPKSSSKSKGKFPAICTKWFAFDSFDIKLKPTRNYTPHEVPEKWKSALPNQKSKSATNADHDNSLTSVSKNESETGSGKSSTKSLNNANKTKPSLKIKSREKLETTLTRLLAKLPNANDPLDAASTLLQNNERPKRNLNHHA